MRFWLLVITSLIAFVMVTEEQQIKWILRHCTFSYNTKYFDNVTSECKRLNRSSTRVDIDMYIRQEIVIVAPIYIHVKAHKKFGTMYRPFMVDVDEEYCSILSLKTHPLLKLLAHESNSSDALTNVFDPCPMTGHKYLHYTSKGFPVSPLLVPIGQWRVDFIVYKKVNGSKEEWFGHRNYFDVSPTSASEF